MPRRMTTKEQIEFDIYLLQFADPYGKEIGYIIIRIIKYKRILQESIEED